MNKVGYLIDEKLKKVESIKDADKRDKKQKIINNYQKVYERFEALSATDNDEVSNRIKLLMKNMLDYRKSGWAKA